MKEQGSTAIEQGAGIACAVAGFSAVGLLAAVESEVALPPLFVMVLVTAVLAVAGLARKHARTGDARALFGLLSITVLLFAICLLGILSVGVWVLPAAVAALVSSVAALSRRGGG